MDVNGVEILGAVGNAPDLLGRVWTGEVLISLPTTVTRLIVAAVIPAITSAAAGALMLTTGVSMDIALSADAEVK